MLHVRSVIDDSFAVYLFRFLSLNSCFLSPTGTMVDASIPLTVAEWEEWGNPNEGEWMSPTKSEQFF